MTETRQPRGPLTGLRVLDLTRLVPGGFGTGLLADMGADVLKIEDTGMGDYIRWSEPRLDGAHPSAAGAHFVAINRGKRSLRLNLKSDRGAEVLTRLAGRYDILVESCRPGVMERLGVGPDRLRAANPRLIYCSVSGYGQTGPLRDRAGHDLTYQARAGLLALCGTAAGPVVNPSAPVADLGGGSLMLVIAVLAAVVERQSSGEGQTIDVSMFDGALAWAALETAEWFTTGDAPRRGETVLTGGTISYQVYSCRDGGSVAFAAMEPKFWSDFCRAVNRPDLVDHQHDPPGSATHRELQSIFLSRARDEWAQFAQVHDCCLEPVLDLPEALASEHVRARQMVAEVEQPGAGRVRMPGTPIKFGRTPADPTAPAPALGADTVDVLRDAGYSASEIEELLADGVAADVTENAGP